MHSLSKKDDKIFARQFYKGLGMALLAAFIIAISFILMAMVTYYSVKYNW
jgi:hypothetical protein